MAKSEKRYPPIGTYVRHRMTGDTGRVVEHQDLFFGHPVIGVDWSGAPINDHNYFPPKSVLGFDVDELTALEQLAIVAE